MKAEPVTQSFERQLLSINFENSQENDIVTLQTHVLQFYYKKGSNKVILRMEYFTKRSQKKSVSSICQGPNALELVGVSLRWNSITFDKQFECFSCL